MGFFSLHEKCSICDTDIGLNRWQLSDKKWICPKCMSKAKAKDKITNILKMTSEEIKKLIAPKITKEYDIININHELIKQYFNNDKKMLYVSFVSYKANTKIHVYSEEKEIIGDIADNDVPEIIKVGFKNGIVFLKEQINNDTGNPTYTTEKVMCTK